MARETKKSGEGEGSTQAELVPPAQPAQQPPQVALAPSQDEALRKREEALKAQEAKLKADAAELVEATRRFEERMAKAGARGPAPSRESMADAEAPTRPARSAGGTTLIINQRAAAVTLYPKPDVSLVLKPGANPVDSSRWELAKRHEHVQRLLALGEDPFSKEGLRDLSASNTRELSVADALLLVRSSTSTEDLNRALEGEQRAVVKDAAAAQAKKLADAEARLKG